MPAERTYLDRLDVALIGMLGQHPHAGFLELSRLTGVSRATLQARTQRLEAAGVITGYGPDVDLPAAGYPVLAFVNLQISQGNLDTVTQELAAIPQVLEAHGTTGDSDVLCKVAAGSHEELQQTLLRISSSPSVVRSTSVVALSQIVAPRNLPLLESTERPHPSRVPGMRPGPPADVE
jgi:DNA-binding Lrp family transcriptional regulator